MTAHPTPAQSLEPRTDAIHSGSLSYLYRWQIPNWSEVTPLIEQTSPLFDADGMKWMFKVYKGRKNQPHSLSTYLGIHKGTPSKLRGIKKKVKILFMVENPKTQAMEFGKEEYPVWFCEKHSTWGEEHLLRLDELDSFVKNDIVQLTVQFEILSSTCDLPPAALTSPSPHPTAFLLRSPMLSDVTLHCVSPLPPNLKRSYPAHRAVLASYSPYFLTLFTNGMSETFATEITLPDTDPEAFESVLAYCYTLVPPAFTVLDDAERLLILADRLAIQSLRDHALHHLRLHVSATTVWRIWALAEKYACPVTSARARRSVARKFEDLVAEEAFLRADEEIVEMALGLDEMNVSREERVFEALMKWIRFDGDGETGIRKRSKSLPMPPSRALQRIQDPLPSVTDEDDVKPRPSSSSSVSPSTSSTTTTTTTTLQPSILISRPTTPTNPSNSQQSSISAASHSRIRRNGSLVIPGSNVERRRALPRLLRKVRFPLMDKSFLVEVVERELVTLGRAAACGKDLLIEAYRFQLFQNGCPGAFPPTLMGEGEDEEVTVRTRERRKFVPMDGED